MKSGSRTIETIDDYLAGVGPGERNALEKLRRQIRAAAPGAEECVSYGIPGFRWEGRLLVSFGAALRHCSFYPGAFPIDFHREALEEYDTSKGTVRFDAARPLPAALVRRLVKARIAEFRRRKPAVGRAPRPGGARGKG